MPPRRKNASTGREPPPKRPTRQSYRIRSDPSTSQTDPQPIVRKANISLPNDVVPNLPDDMAPSPPSFKSLASTDEVLVEPILEELGSDVEVTPAKVINSKEWNAHTNNNDNNKDDEEEEDDEGNDDDDDDDVEVVLTKISAKKRGNPVRVKNMTTWTMIVTMERKYRQRGIIIKNNQRRQRRR